MLIKLGLLLHETPNLFVCEALLKPPQYVRVPEFSLGEPSLGNNAEPFPQHAEELRAVCNHNNRLLHR
jgi:hypothetical protein